MASPLQGSVTPAQFKTYKKQTGNRYVRALGNKLTSAIEPVCILVQGDSTGNGPEEWVYRMSQWLASIIPTYSITYRLWNDTNQNYDNPVALSIGVNGDGYVTIPGVSGSYIKALDNVNLRIIGDIDISAKISAADWTTGVGQCIVSKFGGPGDRGWALEINGTGAPYFYWSADGTNTIVKVATSPLPILDGVDIWVRVTLDVDNGASGHTLIFYTSADGVTWTQLGNPVITAGVTSIFASTTTVEIGTRTGGLSDLFAGKIYKVIVKNGINGKIVASPDFGMVTPSLIKSFKDVEGNIWTALGTCITGNGSPSLLVLNASRAGANVAYSKDVTRFALQTPIEPQLSFISYSHNEGEDIDYQLDYEGLCTNLLTAYPNTGVVCVTQNPQTAPVGNPRYHAIRNRQVALLSAKNDYGLVDVFRAIMETGYPENYVVADGVHPNSDGTSLWLEKIKEFLQPMNL